MRAPLRRRPRRPWPGVLAYCLALAGGVLEVSAVNGGTFGFAAGPLRVSLRNPTDPVVGGVLCLASSYWWLGSDRLRALARRMEAALARRAGIAAGALGVLVVAAAWH